MTERMVHVTLTEEDGTVIDTKVFGLPSDVICIEVRDYWAKDGTYRTFAELDPRQTADVGK